MADVRSAALYGELNVQTATFSIDGTSVTADTNRYDLGNGSSQVGKLVALVSDSTIGLGAAGAYPLGKLIKVEADGKATVQYAGVLAVPYVSANANPPVINRGIQTDGAGNAITPAGGTRLATERGIVISLDSTNQVAYVQLG